MDYQIDRKWSDKYLDQVTSILQSCAGHFIQVEIAPDELDTKHATDMVLSIQGGGTIAVRVRRDNCRYRDLTIRSGRSSGSETELAKIREGWADWYLYGWVQNNIITEWILVDLHILRASGLLEKQRYEIPNVDRSTCFVAIELKELRDNDCLIDTQLIG